MHWTYPEEREINRHHHYRHHPRYKRDCSPEDGSHHPGAQAQKEREESNRARDRVEDHRIGQPVHTIRSSSAEHGAWTVPTLSSAIAAPSPYLVIRIGVGVLTVNRAHHVRGLVANALRVAVVLVRLGGRDVQHAVAECAEGDAGMPYVARVGEGHFEDCDVADDGGGDGGDEEEEGGDEEEDDPDPVEGGCAGHCCCCCCCCFFRNE